MDSGLTIPGIIPGILFEDIFAGSIAMRKNMLFDAIFAVNRSIHTT